MQRPLVEVTTKECQSMGDICSAHLPGGKIRSVASINWKPRSWLQPKPPSDWSLLAKFLPEKCRNQFPINGFFSSNFTSVLASDWVSMGFIVRLMRGVVTALLSLYLHNLSLQPVRMSRIAMIYVPTFVPASCLVHISLTSPNQRCSALWEYFRWSPPCGFLSGLTVFCKIDLPNAHPARCKHKHTAAN